MRGKPNREEWQGSDPTQSNHDHHPHKDGACVFHEHVHRARGRDDGKTYPIERKNGRTKQIATTSPRFDGKKKKKRKGWRNTSTTIERDQTPRGRTTRRDTDTGRKKVKRETRGTLGTASTDRTHAKPSNRVRRNVPMLTKERERNHAPSNVDDVQDRHDATDKSRTNPIPSPSTAEVCRILRSASTNPEPREPEWTCSPMPSTW
mmetsp:Transcript_8400/g.52509  ORF Transcript_8400/g.52509 Transcript_8400/m.52509 type:complete len:205 (+) Transcript_8400:142-756(+)